MQNVQTVSESDLAAGTFVLRPDTRRVQFKSALGAEALSGLAALFRTHPDLELRVYGRDGSLSDLSFLRSVPPLRALHVEVDGLKSLRGIEATAQSLESLVLGATRASLDLAPLNDLTRLSRFYVEGHDQVLSVLPSLGSLRSLTLRSIVLRSLEPVTCLSALEALDLKLGVVPQLDRLTELGSLQYLEVWSVRGLDTLSGLEGMASVEEVYLQGISGISSLAPLADVASLTRLTLKNMVGIHLLDDVVRIPHLSDLVLEEMPHLGVAEYVKLRSAPALERLLIAPHARQALVRSGVELPFGSVTETGRHPSLRSSLARARS